MLKIKKILSIIFVLGVLFTLRPHVYAESETADTTERKNAPKLGQVKDNLMEKRDEVVANRCEEVTKKMDNRIAAYEAGRSKHIGMYRQLHDRIVSLLKRAEAEGIDVTHLREDLSTLDTKIKEAEDIYANFIAKLKEAQSYECGNSNGSFVTAIKESRQILMQFRAAVLDIKEFFSTHIKPELKVIYDQLKADESSMEKRTRETTSTN